ncbi:uncharacterized protein M421DRAFT_415947 [Didymella exigua CBS 183.55]|uniref:Uncharacterized protein n=1 Tax=Didymella exigua CBS 183.55 TaxID=1150837 RepID=A0A6A5RYS0_9PLEO|nr:uncharacterized protein M421DRAFT_415947 [Didymella exigua CBS 183.55]KAF1933605.1 hypothetical protein M421DRAFT_415947 [Didymella exigua CBS 183.55]
MPYPAPGFAQLSALLSLVHKRGTRSPGNAHINRHDSAQSRLSLPGAGRCTTSRWN